MARRLLLVFQTASALLHSRTPALRRTVRRATDDQEPSLARELSQSAVALAAGIDGPLKKYDPIRNAALKKIRTRFTPNELADVVNATTTALGNGAAKRGYDRVVVDDRANVRCDDESRRDRREGARLAGYGEEDGAEDDDGVVVGAGYYAYKEATLAMEQRLLKAMEYELNVEQPHVFMFHIVEVIKGGEALACAASAVLLDALFARDGVVAPDDAATFAAVAVRVLFLRAAVLEAFQVQRERRRQASDRHLLHLRRRGVAAARARKHVAVDRERLRPRELS